MTTDTVSWHPAKFYMPGSGKEEILRTSIERATDTLSKLPGNFMAQGLNRELDIMHDLLELSIQNGPKQRVLSKHPEPIDNVPEGAFRASYSPCP